LGALRDFPVLPERRSLRIAPGDLARAVQTALQARGAALGVAEEAASMVVFAQACGQDAVGELLATPIEPSAALLAAPAALDLACARALTSPEGVGVEGVVDVKGPYLLGETAMRAAERGLFALVIWPGGLSVAGPGPGGPWYASTPASDPATVHPIAAAMGPEAGQAVAGLAPGSFTVVCMRHARAANLEDRASKLALSWSGAELARRRAAWPREGLVLTREQYDALSRAAAALWVPEQEEQRLRPNESTDALKVF
jgi:hypothetical protein